MNKDLAGKMKELRLLLKISRTRFAQMIGVAPDSLAAKESCRVNFRSSEVDHAAQQIARHLTAGAEALATLNSCKALAAPAE